MTKYGLYTSVIINAIFAMVVLGVVPFLLYLSTVFNITLIWFLYKTVKRSEEIRDDTFTFFNSIEGFTTHLENLHEIETYYGDSDLQELISHSRKLINEFIEMQEEYYDDLEITTEEENDSSEKEEKEE